MWTEQATVVAGIVAMVLLWYTILAKGASGFWGNLVRGLGLAVIGVFLVAPASNVVTTWGVQHYIDVHDPQLFVHLAGAALLLLGTGLFATLLTYLPATSDSVCEVAAVAALRSSSMPVDPATRPAAIQHEGEQLDTHQSLSPNTDRRPEISRVGASVPATSDTEKSTPGLETAATAPRGGLSTNLAEFADNTSFYAEKSPARWKVVGARAWGSKYRKAGKPCQDAFAFMETQAGVAIFVSDGAGSAGQSAKGAAMISKLFTERMSVALAEPGFTPDQLSLRAVAIQTIEDARQIIIDEGGRLQDHHATVVGFVQNRQGAAMIHLGDGAVAAALSDDWSKAAISMPENGEYANQTWFFTVDDYRAHLRITYLQEQPSSVVLFTDGGTDFALDQQDKTHPRVDGFVQPVHDFLIETKIPKGRRALERLIKGARIDAHTADDRVVVWAYKQSSNIDGGIEVGKLYTHQEGVSERNQNVDGHRADAPETPTGDHSLAGHHQVHKTGPRVSAVIEDQTVASV